MPPPSLPPNPRTRLILDEPAFTGYEVMLDVWPEVFACGILLVPKDLRPGERRPVVVCQHGLEGRAADVADPSIDDHFYHHFGATLADEGFIVYAPQNPYIGEDRFRILQRLGHPLKLALFSFIIGQHQQTLDWLAALPFVDPARIGFFGLSYGGKTPSACRHCSIATRSPSAPATSTSGSGRPPPSSTRRATCSPASTTCTSST